MADIPAALLVGGMGTRLRSVLARTPKPLAPVGGRSFLGLLVRQLRAQGIRRVVMCTGYLADQIESVFGDGSAWGVAIKYSRERHPLGTAGAVKLAQPCLHPASHFLVMNGDSFLEINLHQLSQFHLRNGGLVTMAVRRVKDAGRYGTVQVTAGNRVSGFAEKTGADTASLVNAGVYVFGPSIFDFIPEGEASFERDVFPRILSRGVYALEQHGVFVDIGTPEDYARAQVLSDQLWNAASRR